MNKSRHDLVNEAEMASGLTGEQQSSQFALGISPSFAL